MELGGVGETSNRQVLDRDESKKLGFSEAVSHHLGDNLVDTPAGATKLLEEKQKLWCM
ncbi:MAG: hypothetical protein ACUVTH_05680 [Thermogutta sp.]